MAPINLDKLSTEGRNPRSAYIDRLSSLEICQVINSEDATVAEVVRQCIPDIAATVDALVEPVRNGGRVIYVGAGTSGRLGVLDASEIPPTYSAPYSQFVGIIAGGDAAIRRAQEGAEDSEEGAKADLVSIDLTPKDSLIGIAASGRTPYVLGCLAYAKHIGCITVGIACSHPSAMSESGLADFMISPVTGAEVVTGSTRMKAGTATKLVLNMISTALMIKIGKTYGNMMIDLKPSNVKLKQRSRNIVRGICGKSAPASDAELDLLLQSCDYSVKLAVAKLLLGLSVDEARSRIEATGGVLSKALESHRKHVRAGERAPGLVVCVDGGATKCEAVVIGKDGQYGTARAGPCNVTDIGVYEATSVISKAIEAALHSYSHKTRSGPMNMRSVRFVAAWIGVAGFDRPSIRKPLSKALSDLLNVPVENLLLSNDIDLQASLLSNRAGFDSAIVLVAGTGSVAMSYKLQGSSIIRTGRSGGWGHVLGDDGSGFDIGKKAIRHTLEALERDSGVFNDLSASNSLEYQVLKHFDNSNRDFSSRDLLSAVVMPSGSSNSDSRDTRHRVASIAPLVLAAAGVDEAAASIVNHAVQSLSVTVKRLLEANEMDSKSSLLILGGGLFQQEAFRSTFLKRITQDKISFRPTQMQMDPALNGAKYLRDKYLGLLSNEDKPVSPKL